MAKKPGALEQFGGFTERHKYMTHAGVAALVGGAAAIGGKAVAVSTGDPMWDMVGTEVAPAVAAVYARAMDPDDTPGVIESAASGAIGYFGVRAAGQIATNITGNPVYQQMSEIADIPVAAAAAMYDHPGGSLGTLVRLGGAAFIGWELMDQITGYTETEATLQALRDAGDIIPGYKDALVTLKDGAIKAQDYIKTVTGGAIADIKKAAGGLASLVSGYNEVKRGRKK
jgi:hypothetical protein